jgi:hypothetical protein
MRNGVMLWRTPELFFELLGEAGAVFFGRLEFEVI